MQERWFSEQAKLAGKEGKADPLFAEKLKKGGHNRLVCQSALRCGGALFGRDGTTPLSAKSYTGWRLLGPESECGRAKQEIDYGLGGSGYVFGAFKPHDGEVFTRSYKARWTANMVDFLVEVDGWGG